MSEQDASKLTGEEQAASEEMEQEPSSEEQLEELRDKHLRLQADFDNFRKRVIKERSDLIRYGCEDLIVGMLDVLDNFDRAVSSSEAATDVATMMQGIVMVQKQMSDVLQDRGVKKMSVKGEAFNPNLHEAVAFDEECEGFEDNAIVEELQSGYTLHDKVIRFAKVKVAKKSE